MSQTSVGKRFIQIINLREKLIFHNSTVPLKKFFAVRVGRGTGDGGRGGRGESQILAFLPLLSRSSPFFVGSRLFVIFGLQNVMLFFLISPAFRHLPESCFPWSFHFLSPFVLLLFTREVLMKNISPSILQDCLCTFCMDITTVSKAGGLRALN